MSHSLRRLILLACAALVASAAPAHATTATKPALGFADQKPSMFDDVRYGDLQTRQARVDVPWDVLKDKNALSSLKLWMTGAKRNHVKVLITFDRSRRSGMASVNPSNAQMTSMIRGLRKAFPGQVSDISTWNEANLNKNAKLVAGWYRALRKGCAPCTILGADLVDTSNEIRWAKQFIHYDHGRAPKLWGIHNYVDVNNYTSKRTIAFAKAIPGQMWLTETGGVLKRLHPGQKFAGTGETHALKSTRYLLETMVKAKALQHKIAKIYLYSWSTSSDDITWDSGMIGPDGKQRSMLAVVRKYLGVPDIPRPDVPPPASGTTVVPQA